jgi:hypothetical protein
VPACPSCHQKRALATSIHIAEEVCLPVAHRQVVFTIPKRLRLHTRYDRKLLGKLASCAWTCIRAEVARLLDRNDVLPGMIAAIQTHGSLLHWHPHIHTLVTCGGWTPQGEFVALPELDKQRLHDAWREAVFALYLAEGKIEPEVVENMRTWPHSGFHVDQSVLLAAGDKAGIERVMQYMVRCPFSLTRLIKVTETGDIVYKAEKDDCRAFPDPQKMFLETGVKRNYQLFSPLDFLAEFTQHIPAKGAHLVRYYGWYSNKARGMRKKAAANLPSPADGRVVGGEGSNDGLTACASATWAMLIKRVYETDPLVCPKCAGKMKVIAFIEPPQAEVIEKIMRHCGLWHPHTPRPPPAKDSSTTDEGSPATELAAEEPQELTYVDMDTFWATF